MIRSRSIAPLVSIVVLIASLTSAASSRGQDAADYAIYAEYSLSNKRMVAGWNIRVFNKKEVQEARKQLVSEGASPTLDDKHSADGCDSRGLVDAAITSRRRR